MNRYDIIGQGIAKTHNIIYNGVQDGLAGMKFLMFTGTESSGLPPTSFVTDETGSNVLAKINEVKERFGVL